MKGIMIFASGVVVGATATLGIMSFIANKRKDDVIDIDPYEDWEDVETKEEPKTEEKEVLNQEAINEVEEFNKKTAEYVSEHKEEPERVLKPAFLTEEEFNESPFKKNFYQWLVQDQLLVDENMNVIMDNRCGVDFVDRVEADGICWLTNDEIEEIFEIECERDISIDDFSPGEDI